MGIRNLFYDVKTHKKKASWDKGDKGSYNSESETRQFSFRKTVRAIIVLLGCLWILSGSTMLAINHLLTP